MKYLLIPLKNGSSSDGSDAMIPGIIMNLISAIIISINVTSKWFPDLHGFGRFALCILIAFVICVLSILPKIGAVICVLNAIVWIAISWLLCGAIPILWLRWGLRIFSLLFIILFEGIIILNSLH